MRARTTLFNAILRCHCESGAKCNGHRGEYSADHAKLSYRERSGAGSLATSSAIRRDDYPATKVIEEPFCAGLGPEKRHKAGGAKMSGMTTNMGAGGNSTYRIYVRSGVRFAQTSVADEMHS